MTVAFKNPEVAKYVEDSVRAGVFPSVDVLLEEAVARMMADEAELTPEDIVAIEEGEAAYQRGEYEEFAVVAAQLRARAAGR